MSTATSASIGGLTHTTTYYWQARANNSFGTTYANGSETAYWSFTTGPAPGAFTKTSPVNAATSQLLSLSLQWGTSTGAVSYEYCIDPSDANNNACNTTWNNVGNATSATISGLDPSTTYYWQVRAVNSHGTTYLNGNSPRPTGPSTTGSKPGILTRPALRWSRPTALSLILDWRTSTGATSYEYRIDTTHQRQ
jgi:predicted phage tail protein